MVPTKQGRSRKTHSPTGYPMVALSFIDGEHLSPEQRKEKVCAWWQTMGRLALMSLSLAAMDPGCESEVATIKGEVRALSPDITGVKVEFNMNSGAAASPPGMDERAGQRGATEYEGRSLKCRDEIDGTKVCW